MRYSNDSRRGEPSSGGPGKMFQRMQKNRILCLFTLLSLFLVIVVGRLFWLQIIDGERMMKMAEGQNTWNVSRNTPRGKILDCNGEELAVSIMVKSLYVNPDEMQRSANPKGGAPAVDMPRLAAEKLAPVLGMPEQSLHDTFSLKGQFVWVKRMLDPADYERVAKVIKDNKLRGLHFLEESKRYYTKKSMAAQVLGFVGMDDSGLAGIELALDSILKGATTYKSKKVDAHGRRMAEDVDDPTPDKSHLSTVYLTLDSKMQFVIEDALDDAMKRTKAKSAAVVIMDPNTGAILAMGSRPTFDPNNFGKYPASTWLNRGISIIYEPGSVFKPIVGCMALTENIIRPDSPIEDLGRVKVADRYIRNWNGEGHGIIPFSDVIKYSINTGMVQIGLKLGAEREIDYAKKFGFGAVTGVELPGEEDGILYDPKSMYQPDVATMAIGQGIAVTPLQMLRAICAIANGGELLQPYIIDRIVAPNGEVIRQGGRKVVRRVVSEEVAKEMRIMMESVVDGGGGKTAAIKGYRIAGKTGTAEKLSEHGGYAPGEYIASFVGFVPADKPQYAMLVMLDTPQGSFYGSQVSAPVFRDTLQQILVAKGIQPSRKDELPSFEAHADKALSLTREKPVLKNGGNGMWQLPDFSGLDVRQAMTILEEGGLALEPYGSGTAFKQDPAAGQLVPEGSKVEIWFK